VRLLKTIAYTTVATGFSVLGGFARNKILAALLSLALFGIVSITQQSVSLLSTICAVGVQLGVTTIAARLGTLAPDERRLTVSRIVVLVFLQGAAMLLVLGAAILAGPATISTLVAGNPAYAIPVAVMLLMAPLLLIETALFAILEGSGNVRGVVKFRIVPAVLTPPVLWYLVDRFGLTGAAAGLLLNELSLVAAALWLLRGDLILSPAILRLQSIARPIFSVGIMSVAVGASWLLVDFLAKRYILESLGETGNGIVQSVSKITDLYPMVVLSWLTMHLFPFVAASKENRGALGAGIERTMLAAMGIIVPIILALFLLREPVLKILYKGEFVAAAGFFGAMLATGIPRVFAWTLGTVLLPLDLKREWFVATTLVTVVYALVVAGGVVAGLGMYAIPLATGLAYVLQSIYSMSVLGRRGIPFSTVFRRRILDYVLIDCAITAAVFDLRFLAVAAIAFALFAWRSGALQELLERYRNREHPAS